MDSYSFGAWLKQRRKRLRLTQKEVAAAAFCSAAMIKKIEADERFPSPELAQSLAEAVAIPPEHHAIFVKVARGQRPVDHLQAQVARVGVAPAPLPMNVVAPSSLPLPATAFVGRTLELETVMKRLRRAEVRLLTLVGLGGIGKTRLALEVAQRSQSAFREGALFVPLAAVGDLSELPQAIFQAHQLSLAGNDPPLLQVQRFLGRRQLLLVLDNFEHLTAEAELLLDLLAAAPGLKLLVTSRERLNLAAEWLLPLPELDEAAALFAQRAVRVQPEFDAQAEEVAVARICALVGGNPLAIALAAGWTRLMPCRQIAAQIEQDVDFLAQGPRDLPERQRSIRAMFDHSWQLLSPAEQRALPRLGVFRGGFAPEQAAAVAGADWPLLQVLVDKSLLEADGAGRFDLHELTRQYVAEKLAAAGDETAARQAHFAAFATLSQELADAYIGPKAVSCYWRAAMAHENFRAALQWGLAGPAPEAATKLLNNLFFYWMRAGQWSEGERLCKQALSQSSDGDSVSRCAAMAELSVFLAVQGRFAEAMPTIHLAYQMARRLGDPWCLAINLQLQGQARTDKTGAMAAYDEAIAICAAHPANHRLNLVKGDLLGLQGDRLMDFGAIAEARACYEASVAHLRSVGDSFWIAYSLGNLGRLALKDGLLTEAERFIAESAAIATRSGNRAGIADWRFRLGQVQLYLGRLDSAEDNLQAALTLYEEIGSPFGPPAVLANLALVAVGQDRLPAAVSYMRTCFGHYRRLRADKKRVGVHTDFLASNDTVDSLLHAGLVAHARGDEQMALSFFGFCEHQVVGFETIQPLQTLVTEARAEIVAKMPPAQFAAVVTRTRMLTLDELLAPKKMPTFYSPASGTNE